jgi:hypothetical protein
MPLIRRHLSGVRNAIARTVAAMPSHSSFLERLSPPV